MPVHVITTDNRLRTNYVVVKSLSDFPTPSGGVITLADDTSYELNGTVDISTNRIVCGTRNIIRGLDRSNDKLVSTTTGALITCDSTTVAKTIVTLEGCSLTCTTGAIFAMTGTLTNAQNLVVQRCTITGGTTLGTIATCNAVVIRNSTIAGPITSSGFTITGTGPSASFIIVRDNSLRGCAGTMFAFGTSVWGEIQIDRNIVTTAVGETFLSGTTGGANVTVAGTIGNNIFTGAGTFISTLTNADTNWSWTDNIGVGNTSVPSAAPAYTAFTKDLGAAQSAGTFDITGLSGLTADKVVSIVQTAAAISTKGNARDEPEMDLIRLTGYVVNATTIRAYWNASGVVVGTYAFAYQVAG